MISDPATICSFSMACLVQFSCLPLRSFLKRPWLMSLISRDVVLQQPWPMLCLACCASPVCALAFIWRCSPEVNSPPPFSSPPLLLTLNDIAVQQARVTVVDWLKELGLYRGVAPNAMRLGVCSRSKDVIEPVLKPQWWVSCNNMAADARAAASDGRLQIIPSEFNATWNRFGVCSQCIASCLRASLLFHTNPQKVL